MKITGYNECYDRKLDFSCFFIDPYEDEEGNIDTTCPEVKLIYER